MVGKVTGKMGSAVGQASKGLALVEGEMKREVGAALKSTAVFSGEVTSKVKDAVFAQGSMIGPFGVLGRALNSKAVSSALGSVTGLTGSLLGRSSDGDANASAAAALEAAGAGGEGDGESKGMGGGGDDDGEGGVASEGAGVGEGEGGEGEAGEMEGVVGCEIEVATSEGGVFVVEHREFRRAVVRLVRILTSSVCGLFNEACGAYIKACQGGLFGNERLEGGQQWRGDGGVLSPEICGALDMLRQVLKVLRPHLLPSLFADLAVAVTEHVDGYLFERAVEGCGSFSDVGVAQLRTDTSVLFGLFEACAGAGVEAALWRLDEARRLLELNDEDLNKIKEALRDVRRAKRLGSVWEACGKQVNE